VDHDAHRLAGRLGVALRHVRRRFLVQAGDDLGILVARVIDDGFLQTAETRRGVDRDVLQADGLQHVRHEVRAGAGDERFAGKLFLRGRLAGGFFRCDGVGCQRELGGGGDGRTRRGGGALQKGTAVDAGFGLILL
jgi:hypothetical protein